jgi:hypothetical protein
MAAEAIEVIDRTEASWQAVLTAFRDPFDEAKAAALAEYFTGNQLEGFNNLIEEFRAGNFRSVPNPGEPEIYDVDPRSVALSLDAGIATVQVCHLDTSLIVETGGNPDGTDRVVSDDIEREIVELDVIRIDGVWKVDSARAPETEIARCP